MKNKNLDSKKNGHYFHGALKFTRPAQLDSAKKMIWNEDRSLWGILRTFIVILF